MHSQFVTYKNTNKLEIISSVLSNSIATNGPFAAAGWEFRERKLGKSTKDY